MKRINLTNCEDHWFDEDTARSFRSNEVVGGKWTRERLFRTSPGNWVLCKGALQSEGLTYELINKVKAWEWIEAKLNVAGPDNDSCPSGTQV